MRVKVRQVQAMVEELEQLVAKRFERKAQESGIYEFVQQVTKDKMLAEKDEELRRMQEMLAQMQVTISWTHVDVQFPKQSLIISGRKLPNHICILG